MKIQVYEDAAALARATSWHLGSRLSQHGRRSLGLAGGSTPGATYDLLSKLPVDWSNVDLWLGDERWVPNDHSDSNGRMARERLALQSPANLLEVEYDEGIGPEAAAASYAAKLADVFRNTDDRPDTVLLGIGDDGHTASLFPDSKLARERSLQFAAGHIEHLDMWRLSATIPMLALADQLVFLVAGVGKAEAMRWLVDPRRGDPMVPARILAIESSNVLVMADRDAMGNLA